MKLFLRISLFIGLALVLLFGGVAIYFNTNSGKTWLNGQVFSFAKGYLKTEVSGDVSYSFPDYIRVDEILIKDQKGDSLLAAKSFFVDIDIGKFIWTGEVVVNKIDLEGLLANLYRGRGEENFNYDFILDAFASDTAAVDTSSSGLLLSIFDINLADIQVNYRDEKLANSASISFKELDTGFKKLDLDKSIYHLKDIALDGLKLKVNWRQNELADTTAVADVEESVAELPNIALKEFALTNSSWDVSVFPLQISSSAKLDKFTVELDEIDLNKGDIGISEIALSSDFIKYDDLSSKRAAPGLDFAHLDLREIDFLISRFLKKGEAIEADVQHLAMKELSGFGIKKLKGKVNYGIKSLKVQDFLFQTNHSELNVNLKLDYPSQASLIENWANLPFELSARKSHLGMADFAFFSPDLEKEPYFENIKNEKLDFKSELSGNLNDLKVKLFEANGLKGSLLAMNGSVNGAMKDIDLVKIDLNLLDFELKKSLLDIFLPDSISQSYGIPEFVKLNGKVEGQLKDFNTHLSLVSNLGNADLEGRFEHILSEKEEQIYAGNLNVNELQLNRILKNDSLGAVSLNSKFAGKGISPERMQLQLDGFLRNLEYNKYGYEQVAFTTNYKNESLDFSLNSQDPKLKASFIGNVQLQNEFPSLVLDGEINEIDLKKLGLYEEDLLVGSRFHLNFEELNPAAPKGNVRLENTSVMYKEKTYLLNKSELNVEEISDFKNLSFISPLANISAKGQFNYATIGQSILNEINQYFFVQEVESLDSAQNLDVDVEIMNHPIIQAFLPSLQQLDPVKMKIHFNNAATANRLSGDFGFENMLYDSMSVTNVAVNFKGDGRNISYTGGLGSFETSAFKIKKVALAGNVADQNVSFNMSVKDSINKVIHGFLGNLSQEEGVYKIALAQTGNTIYYKNWTSNGVLELHPEGILAKQFSLASGKQSFELNSTTSTPNSAIQINGNHIDLNEWSKAVLQDEKLMAGELNADILLKNWESDLEYEGYFQINKFLFQEIALGDLVATASNDVKDRIDLRVSLIGENNDITAEGKYMLNTEQALDLSLDIQKLNAMTLQAFSAGEIQQAEGFIDGNLKITGDPEKPIINGDLGFQKFAIIPTQLGSKLAIDQQKISFKGEYLTLNEFEIQDKSGQKLIVDGRVQFPDLPKFSYKLNVKADNFEAVNAQSGSNEYFYGKASVNTNLEVSGVNEVYSVNGDVKLQSGSHLYLLIPDDELASSEMSQMVTFVDKSQDEQSDTLAVKARSVLKKLNGTSTYDINLEADETSQLTMVLNELTEDYFHLKGNAKLRAGINANDEVYMYGDYVISEGNYEFVFQGIKKLDFMVRKGSLIRWTGDPITAEVNITTEFNTVATLYDYLNGNGSILSEKTLELSKKQVPISLLLKMENTLDDLVSYFEIAVKKSTLDKLGITETDNLKKVGLSIINEDKNLVDSPKKSVLEQKENNINRQAFSLLVLGRFFPDNTLENSSGGINAEAIARKQASKILSDELEKLASGILKGVDLDVGVASEYTAETGDRSTQVNLGLSKAFFDDRVSVSVGRNFELEDTERQSSEVFDNITANYNLSKDRRFQFKAYRKNQYQTVIEGFVVETGVGFSMVFEYDRFFPKIKKEGE